jgi:hypothetical protein
MVAGSANPHISPDRDSNGGLVRATTLIAPSIEFFSGRQEAFVKDSVGSWHRLTAQEAAKEFTGRDRESRELRVGVFVSPRSNGMVQLGFDLWRLDSNLTESTCEHLRKLHVSRSSGWSKAELRYSRDRAHFSKSFAEFVVRQDDLDAWKDELTNVLSAPGSFEPL